MTTRSSYKCAISGISLDPSEGLQLQGRVVHAQLVRSWASTFGIETMPDGSNSMPDAIKEEYADVISPERPLLDKQKEFVYTELTNTVTKALMETGTNEWQKNFLYAKVLMAWYLVIDPRGALETFSKSLELCHSIEDDGTPSFSHLDTIITLLNSALYSFMSDSEISMTIDTIDQQKHTGIRSIFAGSDQSLTRYLAHLTMTA